MLKQHTDASGDGWGCTIEEYGKGVVDYNYGLFTPTLSAHTSNYRELFTVYAGIRRPAACCPCDSTSKYWGLWGWYDLLQPVLEFPFLYGSIVPRVCMANRRGGRIKREV